MRRPRVSDAAQIQGLFLCIGLAIAAFFPFLALYLERYHGLDASRIGVVIACCAAARMIANPFWGHTADTRWGRLTVLQICLAGSAVAALLLNIHWAFAGIVVTAAIHSAFLVGPGSEHRRAGAGAPRRGADVRLRQDPWMGEPDLRGRVSVFRVDP